MHLIFNNKLYYNNYYIMDDKMKEKSQCIICNINSYNYIFALLLPISCMFIHFFQEIMFKRYKFKNDSDDFYTTKNYKLLKYNIPILFYYFFPKLFSIIIIYIIKLKTKGETSLENQNKVLRRYHFFTEKHNIKKILLLIYSISLLEVVYKADDSILYYLKKIGKIDKLIEKRTGFIIFVPLFSYMILNKKLYKHHLFALFLAIIGAIILFITNLCMDYSTFNDSIYHIINIFFSSFFSLALVLIKYLMINYLIDPYNFLFYDGLFCIFNLIAICPFLEYYFVINIDDEKENEKLKGENDNYFRNNYNGIFQIFDDQDWKFYISFCISFIASFFYFIFNVVTIFYFSPYLNVLTDFLTPFLLNILDFIFVNNDDKSAKTFILENIGYGIIIFGALILNEIIIFNFFGLNENTYSNISDRGKLDCKVIEELVPNDETDVENEEIAEEEA